MRILGIETSCDDTAIGIVRQTGSRFLVEAQVTASQALIHRKYGGVVPEVAAREHAVTILPTIQAALRQASVGWPQIDVIAVTGGPGLSTALVVGVEAARTLGYVLNKPIVRVNHIEGHVLSVYGSGGGKPKYPAVTLVVSGGHTELILVKRPGVYRLLGKTIDDAVGEAFDKTAKLLGLTYPGGKLLSDMARRGNPNSFSFPRSLLGKNSVDFSYAGLKTAVLYETMRHKKLTSRLKADIAASFQAAALEPLIVKTRLVLQKTKARSLLVGGGVAANTVLRQQLEKLVHESLKISLHLAPLGLCTDNGVMIAIAGYFHAQKKDFTPWNRLTADPNWELA